MRESSLFGPEEKAAGERRVTYYFIIFSRFYLRSFRPRKSEMSEFGLWLVDIILDVPLNPFSTVSSMLSISEKLISFKSGISLEIM